MIPVSSMFRMIIINHAWFHDNSPLYSDFVPLTSENVDVRLDLLLSTSAVVSAPLAAGQTPITDQYQKVRLLLFACASKTLTTPPPSSSCLWSPHWLYVFRCYFPFPCPNSPAPRSAKRPSTCWRLIPSSGAVAYSVTSSSFCTT